MSRKFGIVAGPNMVARERVVLFTRKGTPVVAEVMGQGGIPLLVFRCPRCGNGLSVEEDKDIRVHRLENPFRFHWPDGLPDQNVLSVDVTVPFQCPHADSAGKGPCGLRLTIRDNRFEPC